METHVLESAAGLRLEVLSLGAAVRSLLVPDARGDRADVVLGLTSPEAYASNPAYLGAVVGRYGNRIGGGSFFLDGVEYPLACNNGPNHLHGGLEGFDRREWACRRLDGPDFAGLELTRTSPDGEEGYPGNLDMLIRYRITAGGEWIIDYEATTDRPTHVNPTQHAYFNLAGHASGSVRGHELRLEAPFFTPTDDGQIPTGEVRPVEGGAFDFRAAKPIGRDLDAGDAQLAIGGGYDHNFVLAKRPGELRLAAEARDPSSGRVMQVLATEPCLQLYTGNNLDGSFAGKDGAVYGPQAGFCLETQRAPDTPNKAHFVSTRLDPGQRFRSTTVYRFAAR